jgi:hypothetical protein
MTDINGIMGSLDDGMSDRHSDGTDGWMDRHSSDNGSIIHSFVDTCALQLAVLPKSWKGKW